MKKLIAAILILAALATMTACGKTAAPAPVEPAQTENAEPEITAVELSAEPETVEAPKAKTEATSEQPVVEAPKAPEIADGSFFRNETNFAPDLDCVSVKPGYVHYENGELVAECYVINGLNKTVYDVSVNDLSFTDRENNLIAAAGFGRLEGLVLAPNQYVIWTFCFGADTVANPSADLSYLGCDAITEYCY